MRKKSFLSIIMAVALIMTMLVGTETTYAKTESKRQIVVFYDNVSADKKTEILQKHKATKIKDIKGVNAIVVNVSCDNGLANESEVRFVEDDFTISIDGSTSNKDNVPDGQTSEQPAEVIPWGVKYMNDLTLNDSNTGAGIKVGIIDTGIDIDHPDLVDNIKGGYNVTSKKKLYDDDNGHGTHVAGIIAAVDNDIGVVGVAPEADLYAVKALNSTGNGYISDVIEGIQWCIDNDMDIVNMSFSMTSDSIALHEAVVRAYDLGIMMVAAAGNNYGGSCEYPAAYEEVIGVGAIDISGDIASFSAIEGVDAWAPGVDVVSTYLDNSYKSMKGTSMASPHYIFNIINKENN